MRCVVGIDGGGTKTRAAAYYSENHDGATFSSLAGATHEVGACNIAFMPLEEALANVHTAIRSACPEGAEIVSICAGVAGFSFATRRVQFAEALQQLYPAAKITVTSDFAIAFRGAFPGAVGILAVAGTGSVVYGSNGAGLSHRAGGYGYLVDDAGSGYGVGRTGLAAVLRAIDGTGPRTTLTERICGSLEVDGWDALIEAFYDGSVNRVKVASFARIVSECANHDNDEVASRILMHAGGALARLVEAVYVKTFAGLERQSVAISCTGSLWGAGPVLTDVFQRSVHRFANGASFVEPKSEPVYGAALIASETLVK